MKITKVCYGETINLGNYQSCRIELQADLEEQDRWQDVLFDLKQTVKTEGEKRKGEK